MARIRRFGCLQQAGAIQFISLLMTQPNVHGSSLDLSVQEFTEVFELWKTKLWSWASLSFSMITPSLLIVFWRMIFSGARRIPGIRLIFSSGRGRMYPWVTSSSISDFSIWLFWEAPLWFQKLRAYLTSANLCSSLISDRGHDEPLSRRFLKSCHHGCVSVLC